MSSLSYRFRRTHLLLRDKVQRTLEALLGQQSIQSGAIVWSALFMSKDLINCTGQLGVITGISWAGLVDQVLLCIDIHISQRYLLTVCEGTNLHRRGRAFYRLIYHKLGLIRWLALPNKSFQASLHHCAQDQRIGLRFRRDDDQESSSRSIKSIDDYSPSILWTFIFIANHDPHCSVAGHYWCLYYSYVSFYLWPYWAPVTRYRKRVSAACGHGQFHRRDASYTALVVCL